MDEKLERALDSTLDKLKAFGIFSTPVIAAIDKHKLPRYDEGIERFLTRGKKDKGTTKFETYATLQSVEEGKRAQIACEHVGFFDENSDIIEKLLTEAKLEGVDIALLLVDREFFGCKIISTLRKLHQPFLMPCRMTKGIKQAIIECSLGKRKSISDYTLKSMEDGEASVTLVILPRVGCPETETDPFKKYIALATNIPKGKILWNVTMIPRDHRRRWGIESGYTGVEEFRARTTSKNHTLRLLYFFYTMILYNAWLLANLILAKRFSRILTQPIISVGGPKGSIP